MAPVLANNLHAVSNTLQIMSRLLTIPDDVHAMETLFKSHIQYRYNFKDLFLGILG